MMPLIRFIFLDILIPLKPMEITQSPYSSMHLPKQADFTESFTSQKLSFLHSGWNLWREKLKKRLNPDNIINFSSP